MCTHIGSSFKFLCSSLLSFTLALAAPVDDQALNPPGGNYPILKVVGKGVQIYQCEEQAGIFQYELLRAEATLYASEDEDSNKILGYHYFLPRPDAGGGRLTWSFVSADASAAPSSTATFKVIGSLSSKHRTRNIASLLLRATSHSGSGLLSQASYAQRLHSIGGVPPSCCYEVGAILKVPYLSEYIFWSQIKSPTSSALSIPPSLHVPVGNVPLVSYHGEGFQIYRFNGTSWVIHNVSAVLSAVPGSCVIGRHYFLLNKDSKGGQPTWEVFEPASRVTAKTIQKVTVEANSIPWLLNEATSHAGRRYSSSLGLVSYVQRFCTSGGNPPSSKTKAKVGDLYQSAYTSIYFFYVPYYFGSSK